MSVLYEQTQKLGALLPGQSITKFTIDSAQMDKGSLLMLGSFSVEDFTVSKSDPKRAFVLKWRAATEHFQRERTFWNIEQQIGAGVACSKDFTSIYTMFVSQALNRLLALNPLWITSARQEKKAKPAEPKPDTSFAPNWYSQKYQQARA